MVTTGANPQLKILIEEIKKKGGKSVSQQLAAAVASLGAQTSASPGKVARKGNCGSVQGATHRNSRQQQE